MSTSKFLDFLSGLKNPEARAAAAGFFLHRFRQEEPSSQEGMADVMARLQEEAWNSPDARRMTLVMLRATRGWKNREIAKLLGVSIFVYNDIELGRQPLSREGLEHVATAHEMSLEELEEVLLMTHALVIELRTSWQMIWQESFEPLSSEARRALILENKDFHNWGLGELLCDKSLESGDPDEATALAEMALLIAERLSQPEGFRRCYRGYAWGHLGHALQRRGNQAVAEEAFEECIKLWEGATTNHPSQRAYAERLSSLVPSFPPYQPVRRSRSSRKRNRS